MVPGVLVPLGVGHDARQRFLLVPPLRLHELKKYREELKPVKELLNGGAWLDFTDAQLDKMAELMLVAVGRNHPTLTSSDLIELLDIQSASAVVVGILGQGKPVMPTPEEEQSFFNEGGPLEINSLYSIPLQA